jgi:hypothetical protein
MAKVWTKEEIKTLILTNDVMLERSLMRIFARQTEIEKAASETNENNGVGFTGADAYILSEFAKWTMKVSSRPEGMRLTVKQKEIARKRMPKYATQLLKTLA